MANAAAAARSQMMVLDCQTCPARSNAEWSVLSDREMAEVNAAKSTRGYHKGEFVYTQGQPCTGVYCMASGTAAERRAEPALPTVLVRLAFSGQTLGYRNFLVGSACATSAKVLEPCVICHIENTVVQRLLRRNRQLMQQFQAHLVADLDAAEVALAHVAWLPVRNRLARLIVELLERNGWDGTTEEQELSLPMTRRDMAELLCTRPETLTRTLQAMESDGLVRNAGHRIEVPNLLRLRAEGMPPNGA